MGSPLKGRALAALIDATPHRWKRCLLLHDRQLRARRQNARFVELASLSAIVKTRAR